MRPTKLCTYTGRSRPRFERLESRLVFSASYDLHSLGPDLALPDAPAEITPLDSFSIVETKGVTLDDAVSLPAPGTTPIAVGDVLDFRTNPYDVQLYKFTL